MIARLAARLPAAWRDPNSLRRKIAASAALSTLTFGARIGLRLVSTIVLTRLLAPEIFGVFAVVMMFLYLLTMLSVLGIRALILTREGDVEPDFVRTCWTVQILRGVVLALACAVVAGTIAWGQAAAVFPTESAYAAAVLPAAIAVLGLGEVLRGVTSPARFLYEREMKFGRVTAMNIVESGLTLLVTLVLAFQLRSVWALVWGNLAGVALHVTLSYALFRGPRLRLNWDRGHIRVIIARGKWIMGRSGLTAAVAAADGVLLGLALPAGQYGFYYIARQIVTMIENFLQALHAQMGLQIFTALQKYGDPALLRQRYYRYRLVFDGASMTAAGLLLTVAPLLVEIIYDNRYADVAGIIQVLAVGLILIGPGLLSEAFDAERRFRDITLLSLVRAVTLWGGLGLAILMGAPMAVLLAVVALHRVPEIGLLFALARRTAWVDLRAEIRLLPLVAVGAGLGWAITWLWRAIA